MRPLAHAVYVWPRQWTEPVRTAIDSCREDVAPLLVLAAEVAWSDGRPEVFHVPIDGPTLAATRKSIGLVVRVGPFAGPFRRDDDPATRIVSLVRTIRDDARRAGIEPSEVQIDFDCASSKLDGYRTWIEEVRTQLSPTPVTITALPTWLGAKGFGALVEATDGYVLQVHSLERPSSPTDLGTLCDPEQSLRWVRRARRFGVPFRVALPTYGYRVAFDRDGAFIGLAAEGPLPAWPEGTEIVELRTDPTAMVALVTALRHEPAEPMLGIAWYRLPVATDTLNWPRETWEVVMRGEVPTAEIVARARTASTDGAGVRIEIELENEGTRDGMVDGAVRVSWRGGPPLASDAIGGFRREGASRDALVFRAHPDPDVERISPGRIRTVGWLRFAAETEVTVELVPPEE